MQYLQLVGPAGKRRVRYYRPLGVQAICLSCHGPRSAMPEPLRARIAKLYPADAAYDYNLDDLRGVVRVEFPLDATTR